MGARMTVANFKPALALVLAHEGGYVNHPRDPGGATNKGVTQKVYDAYRDLMGVARQSVANISLGEAAAIYRQQYAEAIKFDRLPAGIDYAVFDFAVNSGVKRAAKFMQRRLGVEADGHIGLITLTKLAKVNDVEGFISGLCADRVDFLRGLDTFDTFGRGWLRRVCGRFDGYQGNDNGVIDYAINMHRQGATLALPKYIGAHVGEPQTAKAQ